MLDHKVSFGKFKKIKKKNYQTFFSEHNTMRLEVNCKGRKTVKNHKHIESKQYVTK